MKRYLNSFFITLVLYISFAGILFYIFANENIIKKKSEKPKIISLNHIIIEPKVKPKVIPQVQKKIEEVEEKIEKVEKKVIKKEKVKPKNKVIKKIKKKVKKIKKVKKKIKEKKKKVQKEKQIIQKQEVKKIQKLQKQEVAKKIVINEEKEYISKYLKEIRNHILNNVKYPRRARKLSIEGIVKVKFEILKNGKIHNITIIDGHKLLRKATIKAIKRASDDFPRTNKSIEIIIPIEYKLI